MIKLKHIIIVLGGIVTTSAQDFSQPIPKDPKVVIGKLENGLTYYIRQNTKPKKTVELRLVVDAGSMQEDEDQQGVAHFVEHMAFNGTRHFKSNELVDFLQLMGVEFGADLNAYTRFDETVYQIPMSSKKLKNVDKGLMILRDWADGITFDHNEIDKERGVVIEEWRLGQGAMERMQKDYFPTILKGSRYAKRLPIGKKEVIEHIKYDRIKQFYNDWYRPELMAVIVVGDIDVQWAERKIKENFADMTSKTKLRKKLSEDVPDNKEIRVAITSDKENPYTHVELSYKKQKKQLKTLEDLKSSFITTLYTQMLNERFTEITQKPDAPFISAQSSFDTYIGNKDAYLIEAVCGAYNIQKTLKVLVTENERIRRFGFTQSELDRNIKRVQRTLETLRKEKNKIASAVFTNLYVDHFLNKTPISGIDFAYEFFNKIAPTITLEEVSRLAKEWITEENRIVVVMGVDKEGISLPSKTQIINILDKIDNRAITPYQDIDRDIPLIQEVPVKGKLIETSSLNSIKATQWTLSNGAKVIIKPTRFQNDEIIMHAFSKGGTSLYSDADYHSAKYASDVVLSGGIGTLSAIELQKKLSDKEVDIEPYISRLYEGIEASASPKDFETMLQLVHLAFTVPRKDIEAYEAYINRQKQLIDNLLTDPRNYFQNQISRIMTQNHLRRKGYPTLAELKKIKLNKAIDIYRQRFANASDFTFIFVGNIDPKEAQEMIETYIGSLPSKGNPEQWKDRGIRPPKPPVKKEIVKGKEPKSFVNMYWLYEQSLDRKQRLTWAIFGKIVENILIDILREEESGVYTVGVDAWFAFDPYQRLGLNIGFPCAPEKVEKLTSEVLEELKKIQNKSIAREELTKVIKGALKNRQISLGDNSYWANQIESYYIYDIDINTFYDDKRILKKITPNDIQEVAKKYIDLNKYFRFVLKPEKK